MFGDYDDSEMEYDDMAAKERVKDCLERFKLLEQDDSVYFSEEDIEILSNHFFFLKTHQNRKGNALNNSESVERRTYIPRKSNSWSFLFV